MDTLYCTEYLVKNQVMAAYQQDLAEVSKMCIVYGIECVLYKYAIYIVQNVQITLYRVYSYIIQGVQCVFYIKI